MPGSNRVKPHPNNQVVTYNNIAAISLIALSVGAGIAANYNDSDLQAPKWWNDIGFTIIGANYLFNGAALVGAATAKAFKHSTEHLHNSDLALGFSMLGFQALGNFVVNDIGVHHWTNNTLDISGHINAAVTTMLVVSLLTNINTRHKANAADANAEQPNSLQNHKLSLIILGTAAALISGMIFNTAAHHHTPTESASGFAFGVANLLLAKLVVSAATACINNADNRATYEDTTVTTDGQRAIPFHLMA